MIQAFLDAHGFGAARRAPLDQDASLRRYTRLLGGPRPALLMEAADLRPFVRVAEHLRAIGLSAPAILATGDGALLIEDFGDRLFHALAAPDRAAAFDAAIDGLCAMQAARPPALPIWDADAMVATTLATLLDWWWPSRHGAPPPDAARADLTEGLSAMLAPLARDAPVMVHRDFFSGNLIWLPDRPGPRAAGILDFQDAAIGHPAYDLASLIHDQRREIPTALAERATARFLARRDIDPAAIAICAAQRNLRVAGLWARLARRDGKPRYLAYGPHTWRLLEAALKHPATEPLARALNRWIPAADRGNP